MSPHGAFSGPCRKAKTTSSAAKQLSVATRPSVAKSVLTCAVLLLLPITTSVSGLATEPSGIRIDRNEGGYTGMVFKIKDEVPEEHCAEIIQNLRIMLSDASRSLYTALNRRVYFNQATVVVPSNWRDAKCKIQIHAPRSGSSYGAPDFYVAKSDPLHGHTPFTQQSKGCHSRGDFTQIPYTFLTNWNGTWEEFGDPSRVFVHEFAKLRYGIFDQHGFPNDPIYPDRVNIDPAATTESNTTNYVPVGVSDRRLIGRWMVAGGNVTCDPSDPSSNPQECVFHVEMGEANKGVGCSLGYASFLSGVNRYCLANEVWSRESLIMPTKHNGLCGSRSAMDVILSHPDLADTMVPSSLRTSLNQVRSTPPKAVDVRVVREPRTKYVLVLESSSSMMDNNLWKWLSKAAHKFIRYDLPEDSRIGLITFNNQSSVLNRLTELSDETVRARLADSVPDIYKVTRNPDERCVFCGFDSAMKSVLLESGDMAAGAHIILVTRGDRTSLTRVESDNIIKYTNNNKIKVSTILVPRSRDTPLPFYDKVASKTGGKSFVVPGRGDAETYFMLTEAFKSLRSLDGAPSDVPVTVHSAVTTRALDRLRTAGSFRIDSTLGRDSVFGIVVDDTVNHYINSVEFRDSGGQVYGPFTSFTNDFNVINLKTINFPQDSAAPPFDDPAHLRMTWKYEIVWYPGGDSNLTNVVTVESRPRAAADLGLVLVEAWTDHDLNTDPASFGSAPDSVRLEKPLKVFAKVTRGSGPVLMAKVMLKVQVSLNNGTTVSLGNIQLLDNGSGDPDLTQGDGIYSRYLTQYPGAGRYIFQVLADDNSGQAYTIQTGRGGRSMTIPPADKSLLGRAAPCCGSVVNVPQDLRFLTGTFTRRSARAPVLHISDVAAFVGANSNDIMPPSRIGDFRLNTDATGKRLVAHWTAPGDNYDQGTVRKYHFVYSPSPFAFRTTSGGGGAKGIETFHEAETLHEKAGSPMTYSFTFDKFDRPYHLAIYAVDEAGNSAEFSNVVRVFLPTPEDPQTTTESSGGGGADGQENANWLMVGVVAGAIVVVLLLLLLALYIYFFVVRRRRGPHHQKRPSLTGNGSLKRSSGVNVDIQHTHGAGSDHTDASSYDDVKNSSSNHLVPQTISTISGAYKQQQQQLASAAATAAGNGHAGVNGVPPSGAQQPTSFGQGLTPTYWSASQLLKGHEERKRREEEELAAQAAAAAANYANTGYDYSSDHTNLQQYAMANGFYTTAPGHHTDQQFHPTTISYDPQTGHYYQNSGVQVPNGGYQHHQFTYNPAEAAHEGEGHIEYPPVHDPHQQQMAVDEYVGGPMHPANLTVEGSSDADESVLLRQALESSHDNSGNSVDSGNNNKESKDNNTAGLPKLSQGSDNSSGGSSGMGGVINPSLQGSLLSVNSHGRPPSTVSKTRNITQV